MNQQQEAARYTVGEEIANSITHGIGAVLAIGGLAVLVGFASLRGNAWHIVSCSIFGATLVLSYLSSTLYHSIPLKKPKNSSHDRSLRHLSIDCRDLYPLHVDQPARTMGMVAFCCGLGNCNCRNYYENNYFREDPQFFNCDLPDYGLDYRDCNQTDHLGS